MALQSLKMSVWGESGPQEGFFPLLIAGIIVGLSLFIFLKSGLPARGKRNGRGPQAGKNAISLSRVSSYFLLMLSYALLLDKAGFLITSSLFVLLVLKCTEGQKWRITLVLGSASVLLGYLLFVYFLGVPLPRGVLSWW